MEHASKVGPQIERAIAQLKTTRLEMRQQVRGGFRGKSVLNEGIGRYLGRDSDGRLCHLNWENRLGISTMGHGLVRILEKDPRNPGGTREKVTNIFSAPRSRLRVQKNLRKAQENRDLILDQICEMEALVEHWGPELSPLELYAKVANIRTLLGELANSVSATKQTAASVLETTEDALREASVEGNPSKKKMFLRMAVQSMKEFRRQLGQIRDVEVEGSIALNRVREYVLREQRDVKILELLHFWIRAYSAQNAFFFEKDQAADLHFAGSLEKLAHSNLFRDKKLGAIARLKEAYVGSEYGIRDCRNEVLKLIGRAEKEFRLGEKPNRDLANKLLRRAALILSLGKPYFVGEQLEKTLDAYLHLGSDKSIVSYIISGAQLAENNVFARAVYCFERAIELLQKSRELKTAF